MVGIEVYFEPALELSQLIHSFNQASDAEKAEIGQKIYHCAYITRLRTIQSISGVEFLSGKMTEQKVNTSKKDFFYNPAIPSAPAEHGTPPHEMPYHRHDYLELVVVLHGQYTQSINGILHRHGAGDICMLNPNVIHRDVVPGADDRVMFLGLSPNYLRGELARWFKPHPELAAFAENQNMHGTQQYALFHPPEFTLVEGLIEHILEEDTNKLPGHHAIISGLLTRLFKALCDGCHYEICHQSQTEINESLIAEVLRYMEQHVSTVTRETLASFFHFNPDYLNRLLKEVTGLSYSTHLREIRLKWAADRLRSTELSVNAIIRELGFANKGYFNRVFREKYGMLPGEYRRQT